MKILSLSIQVLILSSIFNSNLLCADRRPPKTPKNVSKRALLRENKALRQQLELAMGTTADEEKRDELSDMERGALVPFGGMGGDPPRSRSASTGDINPDALVTALRDIHATVGDSSNLHHSHMMRQREHEATRDAALRREHAFNKNTRRITYVATGATVLYATANFVWAHWDTIGALFGGDGSNPGNSTGY